MKKYGYALLCAGTLMVLPVHAGDLTVDGNFIVSSNLTVTGIVNCSTINLNGMIQTNWNDRFWYTNRLLRPIWTNGIPIYSLAASSTNYIELPQALQRGVTVGELLGTGTQHQLTGGLSSSDADNIMLWNGVTWQTVYFRTNTTPSSLQDHWVLGLTDMDTTNFFNPCDIVAVINRHSSQELRLLKLAPGTIANLNVIQNATGTVQVVNYQTMTNYIGTTIQAATNLFKADGSVSMTGNLRMNGHWISNDGDNEGLFVDTTGNVGIGTNSPSVKLHVAGQARFDSGVIYAQPGGNLSMGCFTNSPGM